MIFLCIFIRAFCVKMGTFPLSDGSKEKTTGSGRGLQSEVKISQKMQGPFGPLVFKKNNQTNKTKKQTKQNKTNKTKQNKKKTKNKKKHTHPHPPPPTHTHNAYTTSGWALGDEAVETSPFKFIILCKDNFPKQHSAMHSKWYYRKNTDWVNFLIGVLTCFVVVLK